MSDDESNKYVESSPFYRLLQPEGAVGLSDVLLRKHYKNLTIDELNEILTDTDRTTLEHNLKKFEENGLVRVEEETVYLQKESEAVQKLRDVQNSLLTE